MYSIAVANQKGGVGKSTTASHVAVGLALRGKKVLLVDGDARRTATRILVKPSDVRRSLADVLLPRDDAPVGLDDVTMRTEVKGLDLIPSTVHLANFDREGLAALNRLKDFLQRARRRYDYAVIDTPPNLGLLVSSALAASDGVLITVQAEPEAFVGIGDLLQLIKVAKGSNRKLEILGALVTMYDTRTRISREVHEALREKFPGRTFSTVIDRQTRLSECPREHQPIQMLAPGSRGAQQYGELAGEILKLTRDKGGRK